MSVRISSSVAPPAAVRTMKPPGIAAARFANQAAESRAIVGAGDFARNADVIDGRHVNQETARESDVTGDARALLAERFLGDLDDDFLTGLEHFGNELRTAHGSVSPLMSAMRAVAVARASATFEASTAAIWTTVAATIGAAITTTISSARPVKASTPAAVAATIPSAALRPLESRARIAADARGITTNEFFAWSVWVAWSARFAGKKNHIFFDDGFGSFTLRGNGGVGFGFHAGDEFFRTMAGMLLGLTLRFVFGFVFSRFASGLLVGIMFHVQIGFGSFDGFLMFAVGFVFGIFASALGFLVLGVFAILFVEEMFLCLVSFFFLFVEGRAPNQGVGFGTCLRFLVLGFDHIGGKSGELFFIEGGGAIVSRVRGAASPRDVLQPEQR